MADIQKTIEIIFGAVDNTGTALESIGKGIKSLDSSVHDITGPLAELGAALTEIETVALGVGAALLGVSIDQAAKFQEAMTTIGISAKATEGQIATFSDQVLAFGQSSGQSLQAITTATNTAVGAGIQLDSTLKVLATTEQLATVTHTDFNTATSLIANTLNAYKASVDDATHFSDVFFQLTRTGVINLDDLNQTFAKVAANAAQAGVPFDTLAAALATLTANGVPATDAMRTIQQIIADVVTPSANATKEATALGVSFNSTALQANGLQGVLESIVTATGGSVAKMSELFGSLDEVKSAMILGATTGKTFGDSLAQIAGSTGQVSESFKVMQNDLAFVNQNIVNNLQEVLIAAGQPLLAQYGDLGRALADVFKSLKIGIDAGAFQPVFDAATAFGAQITTFLQGIAANLPAALEGLDFSGLISAFGDLGDAIGKAFSGFDLTTTQGLHDAIQLVIDGVRALTEVSAGIVDEWSAVIAKGIDLIKNFQDTNNAALQSGGNILGLAQIYEKFRGSLDVVSGAFDLLGKSLGVLSNVGSIAKNWEEIAGVFGKLGDFFFSGPGLAIGAALIALAAAIKFFSDNAQQAQDPTQRLNDLMAQFQPPAVDAAKAADELNASINTMLGSFSTLGDPIAQQVALAQDWTGSLDQLNATLATSGEKIDAAGNVTKTLADSFHESKAELESVGTEFEAVGTSIQTLTQSVDASGHVINTMGTSLQQTGTSVQAFGDDLDGIQTKFAATATSAADATKKSDEYKLKMEQLASDERIAVIKGTFELDLAKLKAQSDQAIAIIDNIGKVIDSTGQLLGTLFGQLNDPKNTFQSLFDIQRQIEFEDQLRQRAADDAHDLAQVQIQTYQAQIDSLRSGTPLFSVNADGVEPELRALLFKLLQLIQVEASGTYGNFLLAVGA